MHTDDDNTKLFQVAKSGAKDSVGARIKLLRHQRGMTQVEFAQALGVGRSAVALWETNYGGESNHLPKIAAVLNIPVEALLTGMEGQPVAEMLSSDELNLIRLYRDCGVGERLFLLRTVARIQRQGVKFKTSKSRPEKSTVTVADRKAGSSESIDINPE